MTSKGAQGARSAADASAAMDGVWTWPNMAIRRVERVADTLDLSRFGAPHGRRVATSVVAAGPAIAVLAILAVLRVTMGAEASASGAVETWAFWVAAAWLVIGPVCMADGERVFRATADHLLSSAGEREGWDTPEIADFLVWLHGWPRRVMLSAFTVLIVFIGALLMDDILAQFQLRPGVLASAAVLAAAVHLGLAAGSGFWGVLAAVGLVARATNYGNRADIHYAPLHPLQVRGLEYLAAMANRSAVYFTTGSILTPALLQAMPEMATAPRILAGIVAGFLLIGGFVAFLLPNLWIKRVTDAQQTHALADIEPFVTRSLRAAYGLDITTDPEHPQLPVTAEKPAATPEHVAALLSLRETVRGASARPLSQLVVLQAASTLAIPVLVLALEQIVTSGG